MPDPRRGGVSGHSYLRSYAAESIEHTAHKLLIEGLFFSGDVSAVPLFV